MGFCRSCGDFSLVPKCKCGGKLVEPLAKSTIASLQSIGDQWQHKYENSILRGHNVPQASVSTPFMQKGPRRTPLLQRNTCEQCNRHVPRPFLIDERFCKDCSVKSTHLKENADTRDHGNKNNITMYRSTPSPEVPSANTHLSRLAARATRVDGNKEPQPARNITRTSSPQPYVDSAKGLTKQPSVVSLSNPTPPPETHAVSQLLQHYQKSISTITPPASPPRSLSSSTSPSPVPPVDLPIPQPQPQAAKSHKREKCAKCAQSISGSRVKIPLPKGQTAWFHRACLTCGKCNEVVTPRKNEHMAISHDLKQVFHIECDPNWRPLPSVSVPVARQPKASCHRCHDESDEKSMLRYDKYHYHRECFTCFGCQMSLVLDKPFYETNTQVYCQPCEIKNRTKVHTKMHTKMPSVPLVVAPTNSTPSSIFRNRTAALPKLGGSKRCPCCQEMISVMEDTPGPKATRWHKKCLKCAGCKKQMDSSAKVTEGVKGGWLVHCRGCMDKKQQQPRMVR